MDLVQDVTRAPWRVRMVPAGAEPSQGEKGRARTGAEGGAARAGERQAARAGTPAPPSPEGSPKGTAGKGGVAQSAIVKKSLDLFDGRLI